LFRFVTKFALVQEFTVPAYSGNPTSQNRLEKLTFDSLRLEVGKINSRISSASTPPQPNINQTRCQVPHSTHKNLFCGIYQQANILSTFDLVPMPYYLTNYWWFCVSMSMCWKHPSHQSPSFQSWSFKVHVLAPFVFVLFISKDNGQILVFCSFL